MSQIITRNAHARSHANSELPKPSPRNGHIASQIHGHGAAPTSLPSQQPISSPDPDRSPNKQEQDDPTTSPLTTPPDHPDPADDEEDENNHECPPHEPNGSPAGPGGEPNPPDGGSNKNDGDEQGRHEGNIDEPIRCCGEPDNVTVRDLLRLLGPILAECQEPPPAAAPNARQLKVNAPDEFDGCNPKKLKSFLVSCNNAFLADPDTFCHHDKCVSYALSYLHRSAQCHFDTQLEDEEVDFIPPNWLNDWPCFVEELHEMFGDPNVEATVEAELDALHMRPNQKFTDFLVDFNTLSNQVNWGDRALCHRLKQALPDRIKDSLVLVEEPAAFNEWKHLVQNIDQWYWEQQAEIRRDAHPNSGTNITHATPAPNVCNTSAGAPSTSATSAAHNTPSSLPVTRHLTAQRGLTQTERD